MQDNTQQLSLYRIPSRQFNKQSANTSRVEYLQQKQKKNQQQHANSSLLPRMISQSTHRSKSIPKSQLNFKDTLTTLKPHLKFSDSPLNQANKFDQSFFLAKKMNNPTIPSSKISTQPFNKIEAYAANTHQGIFRNYNEDRISIILNIAPPQNQIQQWPKCSFFAVYDGHGGNACADYLRDNLHQLVIKNENFPQDPEKSLRNGILQAEANFLKIADQLGDQSGSCALIVLIINDDIYIANVGDCRAVLSEQRGKKYQDLSIDHKPITEKDRIIAAGGRIYQASVGNMSTSINIAGIKINTPFRTFPGKLSVSRTIGDKDAKLEKSGGNPKVVIPDPDIKHIKITNNFDFIIISSKNQINFQSTELGDGIFDRLSSQEVVNCIWNSTQNKQENVHKQCGNCVQDLIQQSFDKKTLDNVSAVLIGFKNFSDTLNFNDDTLSSPFIKRSNKAQYSTEKQIIDKFNITQVLDRKRRLAPISKYNSDKNYIQSTDLEKGHRFQHRHNLQSHKQLLTPVRQQKQN